MTDKRKKGGPEFRKIFLKNIRKFVRQKKKGRLKNRNMAFKINLDEEVSIPVGMYLCKQLRERERLIQESGYVREGNKVTAITFRTNNLYKAVLARR